MKYCLIVDDSDLMRRTVRNILEAHDFETSEAHTGQSGIESCQSRMPDAVFLNWKLSDMTGIEFLAALRGAVQHQRPFVLYCSSENDPADIERARLAGAGHYLLKPFTGNELAAKMIQAGFA
jgi:two-component system chemotaxis response regulator CheY